MSQMGGGLRWHGVSKTGSTATSRIMNAAKAEREKANRSAPKVGSASVTDGDDWLAVAAAERAARRTEATGRATARRWCGRRSGKPLPMMTSSRFPPNPKNGRASTTTTRARRRASRHSNRKRKHAGSEREVEHRHGIEDEAEEGPTRTRSTRSARRRVARREGGRRRGGVVGRDAG